MSRSERMCLECALHLYLEVMFVINIKSVKIYTFSDYKRT